jgi:adenosine kinase
LTSMAGADVRELIEGASMLFTNEYEKAMTESKTGWSDADVLGRVGMRVTTLGAAGSMIERAGQAPIAVSAVPALAVADPTGGGDAFRSGFVSGMSWGVDVERCAQVGSVLASYVLETVGPQEYTIEPAAFVDRFRAAYGDQPASEIEAFVTHARA